jgi:2-polyprenyl-6-methoxyphenol hydroxylase-like FAD-dependent oxidoreductase
MSDTYDVVTIGGGLGGSALAINLARRGLRVLVLERTKEFKDRVRGEGMSPWGVAETKELGIFDLIRSAGHEMHYWDWYFGAQRAFHRNLVETTPQGCPMLTFFHPHMQEVLLGEAAEAGAEVRRGATVRSLTPGRPARVTFEQDGRSTEVSCRLAVGADGRSSAARRWGGFAVQQEPEFLLVSGVLVEGMPVEDQTLRMNMDLSTGVMSFLNPQGAGRVRAYLVSQKGAGLQLQGAEDVARFFDESRATGLPAEFLESAQAAGPLATFSGADTWVEHPYANGVALIGDAASSSDPSWGQGLSLTVRDARVLRDRLLEDDDDWDRAGHAYAAEHDRYYTVSRTVNDWLTELFYTPGPEGDAKRARALPLIAQDMTRVPDADFSGPDMTLDESMRRRMFGEE